MQINRSFIVLLLAFSNSIFAAASSLEDCNQLASQMNKQLPMEVDKITTWNNAVCVPSDGAVSLRYRYTLKIPSNSVTQSDLTLKLRDKQLVGWCTNPDQRELINQVNIEAQYQDQAGTYIGILRYNKSMCKK